MLDRLTNTVANDPVSYRDLPTQVLEDPGGATTEDIIRLARMCIAREQAARALIDLPDGKRSVVVVSINLDGHPSLDAMLTCPMLSDADLISRSADFAAKFMNVWDAAVKDVSDGA